MSATAPTALIADDEPLLRETLARLLRDAWPALQVVAQARNGREAVELFDAHAPDVCFLDVHMPGLSGFDVRSRMHSMRVDVPVILITASDDCGLDRLAAEAGAACLLRKPFSSEQLLEAVGIAVGSDPTEPDATDIAQ